jgi:hypothetical protein
VATRLDAQRPPRGPLSAPYTVAYPSGLMCYLSVRSFTVAALCGLYEARRGGPYWTVSFHKRDHRLDR